MSSVGDDIDDIEDLVAPGDLKPSDRYYNKKDVIVRRKKNANGKIESEKVQTSKGDCSSVSIINSQATASTSLQCLILGDSGHPNSLLENLGLQSQQL